MTIDDHHLRDVLDASFGDGPPLAPPAARLAAGRTALRRRRRAGVAGSAAAVAVAVAASFAVLYPGGSGAQGVGPVAPVPSTATPSVRTLDGAQLQEQLDRLADQVQRRADQISKAQRVSNRFPASLDPDGGLVVKDGWQVTEQVEEPLGYRPPEASLGVVVTDGERTRWMLLTLERMQDGQGNPIGDEVAPSASADDAGKGYSRFEDWLASMVDLQGGLRSPALLTVDERDRVRAGPGATLVEVRLAPVIAGYTAQGDRLAQVTREGRVWFVVVRGHGPQAEAIPVDADVLPEPTFDALVTYLAGQVESGEGVR